MGSRRRTASVYAVIATLLALSAAARGDEPCPSSGRRCAEVALTTTVGELSVGDTVPVTVRLLQGGFDDAPGGSDEIAALVFTVAIPGLELADCSAIDPFGLTPAFAPALALADTAIFAVNTSCAGRASCLCPDAGQPRDEFVNVVIAGPKVLQPNTDIPPLPSGNLLAIALRVTAAATSPVALHLFNAVDDDAAPAGGALLNISDPLAVDVTADASDVSNVRARDTELLIVDPNATPTVTRTITPTNTAAPTTVATATATSTATATVTATASVTETPVPTDTATAAPTETPTEPEPGCVGDCDGGGGVTVDELVVGVGIVLGVLPADRCAAVDCNGDGNVTVACLVAAVNAALSACPT